MRFLVFADLRLDRAFEDAGPEHAAPRRAELRARLDRILALAEAHEVDAVLSAGGLYEHRHLQPGTARFLVDRLGQAGRPVFLAPGAEDPHTPHSLYATTTWPANVHVFDTDLLVPVELADGFRLWGAAHLTPTDTTGFLDGFRITDDAVNLAVFDAAPAGAPFRAEQVEHAGLSHAFVGGARDAVDGTWHTSPGPSCPPADGGPDPQAVVIADVGSDGSLRRQRFRAAGQVHEVSIDLTGVASVDDVLDRLIASIEDLQGTVHVSLHGPPAPGVAVHDADITSWSTRDLEIVVHPRASAPPPHRQVELPAIVAPQMRLDTPSAETIREVTAAHEAWQEALANLRRHAREETEPVQPPDLGGIDLATLVTHLETLRARPAVLDRDTDSEAPDPEARPARPESRLRTIGRAAAALLTVSSAVGLLIIGKTAVERGAAIAALAIMLVIVLVTRRGAAEDPELAATRAQVRATLLLSTELSTASAQARHTTLAALRRAGLPTDADELAGLIEVAHRAQAQQGIRAAWEQRRAELVADLEAATSRLRAVLRRGGVVDTVDVEAAWACFQARANRDPATLPSPTTATGSRLVVGW